MEKGGDITCPQCHHSPGAEALQIPPLESRLTQASLTATAGCH